MLPPLLTRTPSADGLLDKFQEKAPTSNLKSYCLSVGRRVLSLLTVCSYLTLVFPRSLNPVNPKLTLTSYLDALRGYAAYVVYNHHVINEQWRSGSSLLTKLPVVRIWFAGHGMVDVFFIISGYALSYRMLTFIHTKQQTKVMDSLASSIFRRYLRLFLPTAGATFVAMIAISTGLAVKGEDPQVLQPTYLGNLQFWLADTVRASSPFEHVVGWWYGGVFGTKYLPQLWTIPVEFRGSMILFMFLAGTCKMTARTRMYLTWGCIVAFFWWEAQYAGEFLVGMWIADRRISRSSVPPLLTSYTLSDDGILTEKHRPSALRQQLPYIILFFCSLTLLTSPLLIDPNTVFPFNLVAMLMPPNYNQGAQIHYPLAMGAIMLVYALDNSSLLQKPLLLPISQSVGELSFGIYAMHNTVRWIVWERLFVKWQEAYWGPEAHGFWNLLPGYLVMTVLVLWAAELFRRVDMRVVTWGKVLQDICFEQ